LTATHALPSPSDFPENSVGLFLLLQLLYEIGDPKNYILPDVVCDFSQVRLSQIATDEVRIIGAKGSRPTDTYKVCSTYHSGYKATSVSIVAGGRAAAKGRKTAEAILNRYIKVRFE
jgi:hypothetical protein